MFQEKDIELDMIHKHFKQASRKLDDMNEVTNEKRKIESQLRESETQLHQLREENNEEEQKIHSIKQELEDLKTNSAAKVHNEIEWKEIKQRSEMLGQVTQERDALKAQLCKMIGISDVLHKLKCRANEADMMEQELIQLKRELERNSHVATSDDIEKKRIDSACKQCQKYVSELEKSESILDSEIKKNCSTEAERNFLREKCRTIDVMQAELILYKVGL